MQPIIKYINLAKSNSRDSVGYQEGINIYVDKNLPNFNNGSKRLCIEHEKSHFRNNSTRLIKLLGSNSLLETIIELEGIIHTPHCNLSAGESIVKKYILKNGKLRFCKKHDRKEIFERIFVLLDINPKKFSNLWEVIQ